MKRLAPYMVDLAVLMGMFSTGRRSKKPTEKGTGAVDGGTMMTDGAMVKGVGSGLGDIGMSWYRRLVFCLVIYEHW